MHNSCYYLSNLTKIASNDTSSDIARGALAAGALGSAGVLGYASHRAGETQRFGKSAIRYRNGIQAYKAGKISTDDLLSLQDKTLKSFKRFNKVDTKGFLGSGRNTINRTVTGYSAFGKNPSLENIVKRSRRLKYGLGAAGLGIGALGAHQAYRTYKDIT
jgi:hypothetical protein